VLKEMKMSAGVCTFRRDTLGLRALSLIGDARLHALEVHTP
jgi:hypothetical protein